MKRIFVLKKSWFDDRRDKVAKLEDALMSLRLVDAEECSEELMSAALKTHEGIRLTDDELSGVVERAIEDDPEIVKIFSQCHLESDSVAKLRDWLRSVVDNDAHEVTPSLSEFSSALNTDEDIEVLILEEEPEFVLEITSGEEPEDSSKES